MVVIKSIALHGGVNAWLNKREKRSQLLFQYLRRKFRQKQNIKDWIMEIKKLPSLSILELFFLDILKITK